jgi:hypothetical protein
MSYGHVAWRLADLFSDISPVTKTEVLQAKREVLLSLPTIEAEALYEELVRLIERKDVHADS